MSITIVFKLAVVMGVSVMSLQYCSMIVAATAVEALAIGLRGSTPPPVFAPALQNFV